MKQDWEGGKVEDEEAENMRKDGGEELQEHEEKKNVDEDGEVWRKMQSQFAVNDDLRVDNSHKEEDEKDQMQCQQLEIAEQWAFARLEELQEELRALDGLSQDLRRTRLRRLQLELHPDKQPPERRVLSQPLFLLVQDRWEGEGEDGARSCAAAKERRKDEEQTEKDRRQPNEAEAFRRRRREDEEAEEKARAANEEVDEEEWRKAEDEEEAELRRCWGDGPASKLELRIEVGRHSYTINATRAWRMLDVKYVLEDKSNIAVRNQRLLFDEIELANSETLSKMPVEGASADLFFVYIPSKYSDRQYVEKAVSQNWRSLLFAGTELRSDRNIVEAAVKQDWHALQHAASVLRRDRSFVYTAVRQDGLALGVCASRKQRADRELVFAAVRQNWRALQFASPALRADRQLVTLAAKADVDALRFAAVQLMADHKFVLALVEQHGLALRYAAVALRDNRTIVQAAVKKDGRAFEYATAKLREDTEFAQAMVRGNREAMQFVPTDLRAHEECAQWDESWFQLFNRRS